MNKMMKRLYISISFIMAVVFCSMSPVSTDACSQTTQQTQTSTNAALSASTKTYAEIQAALKSKTKFHYKHDPRDNCKAMQDIKVDPDAIYGFSPREDSAGLGAYASYDWSDAEVVENARQSRIEYLNQFEEMYDLWEEMKSNGSSTEEIARAVSKMRNDIRIASYKDDPDGLAVLKERNLAKYGNEDGPTPEYLYDKYGSWEEVLYSAFSSNPGMDACLGLYDDEYNHLLLTGEVTDHTYDEGKVTKKPTLLHSGKKVYTCTACGIKATKLIPALIMNKHGWKYYNLYQNK